MGTKWTYRDIRYLSALRGKAHINEQSGAIAVYAYTARLVRLSETPYAVVLVELGDAPGVRMISNLVNCALDRLKAGLVVEAVFTPSADTSVKLVNWQPAAGASG